MAPYSHPITGYLSFPVFDGCSITAEETRTAWCHAYPELPAYRIAAQPFSPHLELFAPGLEHLANPEVRYYRSQSHEPLDVGNRIMSDLAESFSIYDLNDPARPAAQRRQSAPLPVQLPDLQQSPPSKSTRWEGIPKRQSQPVLQTRPLSSKDSDRGHIHVTSDGSGLPALGLQSVGHEDEQKNESQQEGFSQLHSSLRPQAHGAEHPLQEVDPSQDNVGGEERKDPEEILDAEIQELLRSSWHPNDDGASNYATVRIYNEEQLQEHLRQRREAEKSNDTTTCANIQQRSEMDVPTQMGGQDHQQREGSSDEIRTDTDPQQPPCEAEDHKQQQGGSDETPDHAEIQQPDDADIPIPSVEQDSQEQDHNNVFHWLQGVGSPNRQRCDQQQNGSKRHSRWQRFRDWLARETLPQHEEDAQRRGSRLRDRRGNIIDPPDQNEERPLIAQNHDDTPRRGFWPRTVEAVANVPEVTGFSSLRNDNDQTRQRRNRVRRFWSRGNAQASSNIQNGGAAQVSDTIQNNDTVQAPGNTAKKPSI